ncbi:hypothetical protein [Streptomyces sp. NPDC005408]|uniref:hypothetical protein n=1 Tax=Streptomyces sp. NPDC005408 TaxID=3155341 RepID=UPI0033BC25D1
MGAAILVGVLAGGTASRAAAAQAATEPPPTRADIAADALRKDPVYLSPHLDEGAIGPRDSERIRTAARELKAAGIPVYVSVSPVWEGDGSGKYGIAYLALLHDRLRKDGAYVHVDQSGRARLRAYGVSPAGDVTSVENRLRGWSDDGTVSLGDITVAALNGLRTGQVPGGHGYTTGDDMAYRAPEYRAEKAALAVGSAGAVVVALLGLLHRFTDLPLWPRRRRSVAETPAVDWRSAPELPDLTYRTLYELAERRRDALGAALMTARAAGLAVEGSIAAVAWDLADDLVICCIPGDFETEDAEGLEVVEAIDLPDVVAAIEISRMGMRALAALRDGVPFDLQPPCFHNPLHERGTVRRADVTLCADCAEHGPDPLLVRSGDRTAPYYESDDVNAVWKTTGYGAATPDWDAERLLAVFATWVDSDSDSDSESDEEDDA